MPAIAEYREFSIYRLVSPEGMPAKAEYREFSIYRLVSPEGMPAMQTAEMPSRLKAAEPTMVPGPSASASKPLPTTPTMASRISGAEEPGHRETDMTSSLRTKQSDLTF